MQIISVYFCPATISRGKITIFTLDWAAIVWRGRSTILLYVPLLFLFWFFFLRPTGECFGQFFTFTKQFPSNEIFAAHQMLSLAFSFTQFLSAILFKANQPHFIAIAMCASNSFRDGFLSNVVVSVSMCVMIWFKPERRKKRRVFDNENISFRSFAGNAPKMRRRVRLVVAVHIWCMGNGDRCANVDRVYETVNYYYYCY